MRAAFVGGTLLGSIAVASSAHAGNDDEILVGNRASMLGGAVSATVNDASATWYNPAGLGGDSSHQIDVSATAYSLRSYSVPNFISTTGGASKDGAVTEFVSVPTQIAYVRKLSPNWSLGLGYFAPHVTNYVLREGLGEKDPLGSQWQVSAAVADTLHTAGAALGGTIAPGVRAGASLIGAYSTTVQAISFFGAVKRGGMIDAVSNGAYFATVMRLSLEAGFGVQVDVTSKLTLAVTARTPRFQIFRDTDVSLNETYGSNGENAGVFGYAQRPVQSAAGVNLLRAGRAGLGLAYRFGRGFVSWDFDVQPGLESVDGDVNRRGVLNARVGIYQGVLPGVALGAGLFTDRSPDTVRWSLLTGSGDFYGGTVGIELDNERLLAANEPAKSLRFTTVFALRYAYSNGEFGRAVGNPETIGPLTGTFQTERGSLRVHELGFYVGSGLHF